MIQWILAIWSLVPLPFLKPAWTSGSSQFTYCWSLAWRILSITLLACEMRWVQLCGSLSILWDCLSLGLEWKLNIFQSCGHCWVLPICWHIECSIFTASSFTHHHVSLVTWELFSDEEVMEINFTTKSMKNYEYEGYDNMMRQILCTFKQVPQRDIVWKH